MTDNELADNIRVAALQLWNCIDAASVAGLTVKLDDVDLAQWFSAPTQSDVFPIQITREL